MWNFTYFSFLNAQRWISHDYFEFYVKCQKKFETQTSVGTYRCNKLFIKHTTNLKAHCSVHATVWYFNVWNGLSKRDNQCWRHKNEIGLWANDSTSMWPRWFFFKCHSNMKTAFIRLLKFGVFYSMKVWRHKFDQVGTPIDRPDWQPVNW